MKRLNLLPLAISALAVVAAFNVKADVGEPTNVATPADPATLRVYVNPGHGSWGSNDRPLSIIREVDGETTLISPNATSQYPDTTAFFETNTNLQKCFGLVDRLIDFGLVVDKTLNQSNSSKYLVGWARALTNNIVMSRTKNGPYPNSGTTTMCNRGLTEIAKEVEYNNFDMFISVHSNAGTDGANQNYYLSIYRGTNETRVSGTHGTEAVAGSYSMGCRGWDHMHLHPFQKWTSYTVYSSYSGVKSDRQFYTWVADSNFTSNSLGCYGYLGVLKHHTPGYLTEGYFHTYKPSRMRAMNFDTDRIEGILYARGIADYFQLPRETTGEIYGLVRGKDELYHDTLSDTWYSSNSSTNDKYMPINGCTVILKKDGEEVARKTTDMHYNGAFVFERLEPGDYTLEFSHVRYHDAEADQPVNVTVTAAETQFKEYFLRPKSDAELARAAFPYNLQLADTDGENNYRLSFYSSSDAESGTITVVNRIDASEVHTYDIADVYEGENFYMLDASTLTPGEEYSWSVTIESSDLAAPIKAFQASQTPNNTNYVNRGGVVVFTDPAYDTYGMVVTSTGSNQGFNVYAPTLTFQGNYLSGSYNGFSSLANYSPYRGTQRADKAVFVDWGSNQGGFWEYDPLNPSNLTRNLLLGTNTNGVYTYNATIVGGSATAIDFVGSGASEKLYVFSQHHPTSNGTEMAVRYDIAGASDISTAPDAIFNITNFVGTDFDMVAVEDGFFLSRESSSAQTEAAPGFAFFDNSGTMRMSSYDIPALPTTHPASAIALSVDKSMFACSDNANNILIFDVEWTDGVPTLTYRTQVAYSVSDSSGTHCQMQFDPAGNLFVFGRSVGLACFAMPRTDKTMTMAAPADQVIEPKFPPAPVGYAYDLTMVEGASSVTVSFKASTEALAASVDLVSTVDPLDTHTYNLGAIAQGLHSLEIPLADLTPNVDYAWSVTLDSRPVEKARCVLRGSREYATDGTRGGIVVITDPRQASFGKVITSSSYAQGIDVYSPEGTHLGTFHEGRSPMKASSGFSLYRGAERKGKAVFVDWSDPGAGFWVFDPENTGDLTDMMLGTVSSSTGCHTYDNVIIGGGSPGLCFLGEGDDERLYSFVEDYPASASHNLVRYDLEGRDVIDRAPAFVYPASLRTLFYDSDFYCRYIVEVIATEDGLFLSRASTPGSNTETTPGFVFVDHEGNVLLNSYVDLPDTQLKNLGNGMALSADHSTFAISDHSDGIEIYSVEWNAGVPSLTYRYTVKTDAEYEGEHTQMKFDYAGNLAVFGRGSGYQLYALPNPSPSVTTPARAELYISNNTIEEGGSINLVDATPYSIAVGAHDISVTYSRDFTSATEWEGLYIPFDLDYEDWQMYADVAALYNLHIYSDGSQVLEFETLKVGDSVEQNLPYIIRSNSVGNVEFECSHKTLTAAPATPGWIDCFSTRQHFTITGNYGNLSLEPSAEAPKYVLIGNAFDRVMSSTDLQPYRIYLTVEPRNAYAAAPPRRTEAATDLPAKVAIMVDGQMQTGDTTGVENVEVVDGAQCLTGCPLEFFNLQGQPVAAPAPGQLLIRRCAGSTEKIVYKNF